MLSRRIITALILGAVLVAVVLLLPTRWVAALLGLVALAGAWEWGAFARLEGAGRAAYLLPYLLVMLSAPWWMPQTGDVLIMLVLALVWWLLALGVVLAYPCRLPRVAVAVAGLFVLLPAWAALVHLHGLETSGPGLVLTVFLIVSGADIGAYFTGRAWGRHKLAPRVSGGKTWEGALGGLALAVLVGAIAGQVLHMGSGRMALLGLVTALVSIVGDLLASVGKRNVGLKDSGKLLPGHGGVIDRIDSLCAAAPVFACALLLCGVAA